MTREALREVVMLLVQALEMAAGLREPTVLLEALVTKEAQAPGMAAPAGRSDRDDIVISFSGGVADCIEKQHDWLKFGDIGPILGEEIRNSRLCAGEYRLGVETIRATVIGAGCHSAQLSGSTVFYRNVRFPLKNLTAVTSVGELESLDEPGLLVLEPDHAPSYRELKGLAAQLAGRISGPVYLAMETDMAKALGHALALLLPSDRPVLCVDSIRLRPGDYLDVGEPVGPALPVVVKTLILER